MHLAVSHVFIYFWLKQSFASRALVAKREREGGGEEKAVQEAALWAVDESLCPRKKPCRRLQASSSPSLHQNSQSQNDYLKHTPVLTSGRHANKTGLTSVGPLPTTLPLTRPGPAPGSCNGPTRRRPLSPPATRPRSRHHHGPEHDHGAPPGGDEHRRRPHVAHEDVDRLEPAALSHARQHQQDRRRVNAIDARTTPSAGGGGASDNTPPVQRGLFAGGTAVPTPTPTSSLAARKQAEEDMAAADIPDNVRDTTA